MTLFDLSGKTVVITGSSRGIGRAIAEAMVAQGARVVISSRKQDACDAVAAEINAKYGDGNAVAIAASLGDRDSLEFLIAEGRRRLGPINMLVCNAASNPYYGPLADISDEHFRRILDNNILANHWLIRLAAEDMKAQGEGSIVIISSIGGFTASTSIGAYNISKAADFQLARNYAAELGPSGIRVNCIAPGLVKTDFARALWENPQTRAVHEAASPLRRIGEPEDIAGAAVFLASPAARFITGQAIVVDGGTTIGSSL
jgi:NAD(P)-dependent dehydrogenase (short-subunit alcohol dehydrogenase family)